MKLKHDWSERKDVTREMADVAARRTAFLFGVMVAFPERVSVKSLLTSAYLQGMEDAADAENRAVK